MRRWAVLLSECPDIDVLATSRTALHVVGEQVWQVAPLSVPAVGQVADPAVVATSEAATLFVERARAGRPSFTLSNGNAAAVVEICQRLDGLPLAIELAAARVSLLSADQIAEWLDDRFRLLHDDRAGIAPRQQALRATLDWSYDLLSEAEQALFARLSIFVGGFDLDAVEAIMPGLRTEDSGLGEHTATSTQSAVLDLLGGLVAQSLVTVDEVHAGGRARYRLLDTRGAYARARLIAAGDEEETGRRHAEYFLSLAEAAAEAVDGPEQAVWLDRLERDHDNLLAALTWWERVEGGLEPGLRLAGALGRFWEVRGYFSEGRDRLARLLARSESSRTAGRCKALNAAGRLAAGQGAFKESMRLQEAALAGWRAIGDRSGIGRSLLDLAYAVRFLGDHARTIELGEEALALYRDLGDRRGMARALLIQGTAEYLTGAFVEAEASWTEGLALYREVGDKHGEGMLLNNRGMAAERQGKLERAAILQEQNLALTRAIQDRPGIAMALGNLGEVARRRGNYEKAAAYFVETLPLFRELGDHRGIAISLENLGLVALEQQRLARGVLLLAAATNLRATTGVPPDPHEQEIINRLASEARDRLGEARYETLWSTGCLLSVEQAIAEASRDVDGEGAADRPGASPRLTARQRDVLRLIVTGGDNRQIAAALGLSPRTVERHLTAIYTALGISNRVGAVAIALRDGLVDPEGDEA